MALKERNQALTTLANAEREFQQLLRHLEDTISVVHKSYHEEPHSMWFCPMTVCRESVNMLHRYQKR